jgi:hypothetical protein
MKRYKFTKDGFCLVVELCKGLNGWHLTDGEFSLFGAATRRDCVFEAKRRGWAIR